MFSITDHISLSDVPLAAGILSLIVGGSMAFSRKERERVQKRVIAELPQRSAITGSSEALRIAQRRGYIILVTGIVLLVLWLFFFWVI